MSKSLLAAASLFLTCAVPAHAGGWQEWTAPLSFSSEGETTGARGYLVVETSVNPDGCSGTDTRTYRVDGSNKKGQYIIAAILVAIAEGKELQPQIQGCDDLGHPMLIGVRIRP
ncbi:MAG TPA: hypothetical protein VMH32_25930 [Burkholderiales bacterium]|nr:hypothetical protein [Burkholderiales bacterium]